MIQTQENDKNDKKPHFGPDLGLLSPNFGCRYFFSKISLYQSVDIMISYHVQYHKEAINPILTKVSDGGKMDGQMEGRMDAQTERWTYRESDRISDGRE